MKKGGQSKGKKRSDAHAKDCSLNSGGQILSEHSYITWWTLCNLSPTVPLPIKYLSILGVVTTQEVNIVSTLGIINQNGL